jgi:hypothetical protein
MQNLFLDFLKETQHQLTMWREKEPEKCHNFWLCGGYVRDLLLDKENADYDFVVTEDYYKKLCNQTDFFIDNRCTGDKSKQHE